MANFVLVHGSERGLPIVREVLSGQHESDPREGLAQPLSGAGIPSADNED
jgi:hypothetical protein